jgi:PBSX family phage terminase large subunit
MQKLEQNNSQMMNDIDDDESEELNLEFSEKQYEYIVNCNRRYNFKVGAVRSGKSYVDIAYTILSRIQKRKGKSGLNLIMGVSKESIERNVLTPMREIYTDGIVGHINSNTNIAMICGEEVYCLGASKKNQVDKIQGMSVKYCYGDEVAKWHKDVFKMLQSRLDKKYSCFDGALNPESPKHWLKTDILDNDELDMYIQEYTIFDNPFLPKEFVSNLCKEYKGVFYDRYIKGEWANAEGLIFGDYKNAIAECPFVLNEKTFKSMSKFCISIDYGIKNAFAALLWVKIDDVWWAWRGYYYSGRTVGKDKDDLELLNEVIKLVSPLFIVQKKLISEYKLQFAEKIETIIDPSATSFITALKKKKLFKVKKAKNSVFEGLKETDLAINLDLIKINSSIKEWEDEAAGYIWDESKNEDLPVKVDDHYMDATRYFVMTKGFVKKYIKDDLSKEYLDTEDDIYLF